MDCRTDRCSGCSRRGGRTVWPGAVFYGRRGGGSVTREEYRKSAEDVIYLASCAVNGVSPDAARVAGMDMALLYKAADFHMLAAITAMALETTGVHDPAFTQAKAKAIRKAALMDAEMAALFARLKDAGIWYMPLKGAVLKDYYPAYGMRQMADNDILFDKDRVNDVKSIMESLGFEVKQFGTGVHDSYFKEPVCCFEMHRALFSPAREKKMCVYYQNVQKRLVGGGCEKRFKPEDFYLYITAHEYRHYSGGGTGIRSLLDTYIYLKKEPLDMNYVAAEAEKLGIKDFEEKNRSLSLCLFSGEELTGTDAEMLDYILSSGANGTLKNGVRNKVNRLGGGMRGKSRYLLSRIFLPMKSVQNTYPFFYRHKILLPILPLYRIGKGLAVRRARVSAELKELLKRTE